MSGVSGRGDVGDRQSSRCVAGHRKEKTERAASCYGSHGLLFHFQAPPGSRFGVSSAVNAIRRLRSRSVTR